MLLKWYVKEESQSISAVICAISRKGIRKVLSQLTYHIDVSFYKKFFGYLLTNVDMILAEAKNAVNPKGQEIKKTVAE